MSDNAKPASAGTSATAGSAGWEWHPRDWGFWPLVNWVRRMAGKGEIGDVVYSIHFDKPLVLQPGESMTLTMPLPNEKAEGFR